MQEIKNLITRALKYIGSPSGTIKHIGTLQDDVIFAQNNFDAGIGLLKEALSIDERKKENIRLVSFMISKQLENEACNSHKTDYMKKLAKDFAYKFQQEIPGFERETFFRDCGIRT